MLDFIIACFVYAITTVFIFLSFFLDYRKGNPLSKLQRFAVLLLFIELFYGTWDLYNRFLSAEKDKKEIIDTTTMKAKEVIVDTDTTRKVILRKIDSAKQATIDSMKVGNDAVVRTLQKTIREQARVNDSLMRLHVEKHLTEADKKGILKQLRGLGKEHNEHINNILITVCAGSNAGVFIKELSDFLTKQGFQLVGNETTTAPYKGYGVYYLEQNTARIFVGYFDLSIR